MSVCSWTFFNTFGYFLPLSLSYDWSLLRNDCHRVIQHQNQSSCQNLHETACKSSLRKKLVLSFVTKTWKIGLKAICSRIIAKRHAWPICMHPPNNNSSRNPLLPFPFMKKCSFPFSNFLKSEQIPPRRELQHQLHSYNLKILNLPTFVSNNFSSTFCRTNLGHSTSAKLELPIYFSMIWGGALRTP